MDADFENRLSTRDVGEELRTAAGRGDLETTRSILTRGRQNNAKDHDAWSELSYSPRVPRRGMDEKPCPAPAEPATWKRTPGTLPAYLEDKDRSGLTALAWAAYKGHVDIAQLLVDHGSDVEAKDGFGRTPLMIAAAEGNTEVVHFLAGVAQVNAQDDDGRTALAWAASRGRLQAAEALINLGVDLEVVDKLGYRALTWAAIGGIMPIVELLLDRECELEAKDVRGMTPLVLAATQGHDEVAHRLAAEGARVPLELRDVFTQLMPVGRRPKQQSAPVQDESDEPAKELGEPLPQPADTEENLDQTGGVEEVTPEGETEEQPQTVAPEGETEEQPQMEQQ